MATRPTPYRALGTLLETWRKQHYRSASEMFRRLELSCAYSTYKEFERGIALPSVAQLLELVDAWGEDAPRAVRLWAEVQMPTEDLRQVFRDEKPAPAKTGEAFPLEKQWTFGKAEHDFLEKQPWFFDLCLKLVLTHPGEVSFEALGLGGQGPVFCEKYLRPWILLGRILESPTGLRAAEPHLRIPNTPDWADVRARNFHRAYTSIDRGVNARAIEKGQAFREIATRGLSSPQLKHWIQELTDFDRRFRSDEGAEEPLGPDQNPYTLLTILGPRELALPREVLEDCGVGVTFSKK